MQGLTKVQRESSGVFKMAFVRCQNVYEVTFHKRVPEDVCGSDIDLAARLLSRAKAGEILMNAACHEEIIKRMKGIDFPGKIDGPQTVSLKGFGDPVDIFLWRVPAC